MRIRSDIDGGNIELIEAEGTRAKLAIRSDTNADEFRQWFHFRVDGARGQRCQLDLVNAGQATYPDAWEGYRACASYDLESWFRVPTSFDGDVLAIDHTPERSAVYYAYFAPYPLARHDRLLARARWSRRGRVERIGRTVEGRPMSLVIFGDESPDRRKVWICARQHPGETMAEWFMEGIVDRLVAPPDAFVGALLDVATLYLVTSMNPDGGVHGNLRANAAGSNLNRAWLEPTIEASPEVLCVRDAMHELGVDLLLDVHGDERNPFCFLAGCEGNPGYSERIRFLENLFEQNLLERSADFQDEYGYDRDEPGGGDLRTAANYAGETFDCLAYTVEMPFKDAANHPDPSVGWSPARCRELGVAALESALACVDELR